MRLACEARALHVPGKSLSYLTSDVSFPLRIRLIIQYTLLFYHWTSYPHPYLTVIIKIELLYNIYFLLSTNNL
jgi:hypothetical protein